MGSPPARAALLHWGYSHMRLTTHGPVSVHSTACCTRRPTGLRTHRQSAQRSCKECALPGERRPHPGQFDAGSCVPFVLEGGAPCVAITMGAKSMLRTYTRGLACPARATREMRGRAFARAVRPYEKPKVCVAESRSAGAAACDGVRRVGRGEPRVVLRCWWTDARAAAQRVAVLAQQVVWLRRRAHLGQ